MTMTVVAKNYAIFSNPALWSTDDLKYLLGGFLKEEGTKTFPQSYQSVKESL